MRKKCDRQLGSLVRATLAATRLGELSDGELLTRFVSSGDEPAFAELVRRLGPTVFGVCQRILRATQDAEDAFQVAFLVLARKAARINPPGRVAAWLHGVAVLAARKTRAARLRRLARETTLVSALEASAPTGGPEPDLAQVLDEEIDRLPERYRLALVLCEVRELTVARAAVELGWPAGTVASRLSRGRAMLAARLESRGVAGGIALAGFGAVSEVAVATVPSRLLRTTVSAVVPGGAVAPAVTPPLMSEVLWAMTMSKVRVACLGLTATAAIAFGGVGLFRTAVAAPVAPVALASAAPVPKTAPTVEDPLARVKVEQIAALLQIEAIKKDISLTDDQSKKLDALRAEYSAKQMKRFNVQLPQVAIPNGGVLPGGAPGAAQIELMVSSIGLSSDPAFQKTAEGVVSADQLRRLKQITLQSMGPAALLDRRVIRALGLTADQEDKIDALLPHEPEGNVVARVVVNGQQVDPLSDKVDAAWAAALKVLTPEQQTKWNTLVGKMLPNAELRKVHTNHFQEFEAILPNIPGVNPGQVPPPE
ncbi:MAG: hypothetical protein C0467_06600 [Planctomycetaceae bacterium]|nr:hypothetical protein [Planctomycetaceae bacterium]